MIPELGHFTLILALVLAAILAIVPLAGSFTGQNQLMAASRSLASGLFIFISLAFACLTIAFVQDDFSVAYVAHNSNSLLPIYYKACAVWGGHEGSLLLWVWMLSAWTFAISLFSRNLPLEMLSRVLSVMGMIAIGFLLFMLLTSNPFDRLLPDHPSEGRDLNPLLQDPGFIFHPPMLYMGYVGFSVAFAFAIAALIGGRLDSAWARWSRPWSTIAWAFLTLGIALGSWWAYYELGWGGWWFWDPVENASFMPWLVGTALIHSLAVTEKRGVFKSWTILLAILAFSLSLLGTFLVRSGVITSVHAFATDPTRGYFILGFLSVVIGGSLALYAFRAPQVKAAASFNWLSRETLLLINNILFVVIAFMVLMGTLYPIVVDLLDLGRVSVGPPYFNLFFIPLICVVCVALGLGPIAIWKKSQLKYMGALLLRPLVISVLLGAVFPIFYGDHYSLAAAAAVAVGSWVVLSTLADFIHKSRNASSWSAGLRKLSLSYYGMVIAHIGIGISVLGITLNPIYSDQKDLRMTPGVAVEVGGKQYLFNGVKQVRGPNYLAQQGNISVFDGDKQIAELQPEKRNYLSGGNTMTEAAINTTLFRDLYVALGEPLEQGSWAVRVHYKPFVLWIWLGAVFMAIGGFLAVADKRYRAVKLKREARQSAASEALSAAAVSENLAQ
ncbi:heme lyase CcmF/NrfE family subunit [Halioxenophilus sp. WMMB6]|uniref:heme lyase CcmF/NrfE family subunit n=1 Tax=Halioxenophilus sp. WMMB6 TaxID=3073815 RepID=UPI00295EEFDB|nr:heme lyase CcmF/NrfE family subunit [Halioxenophilus sp. WMMB6]